MKKKNDSFKVVRIIKGGTVEFNLLISKSNNTLFVHNSTVYKNEEDAKKRIAPIMKGRIEAISYDGFEKVENPKKKIICLGKLAIIDIYGELVEISENGMVVDCGFFICLTISNTNAKYFKKGDHVRVSKPDLWVYNLKKVEGIMSKKIYHKKKYEN